MHLVMSKIDLQIIVETQLRVFLTGERIIDSYLQATLIKWQTFLQTTSQDHQNWPEMWLLVLDPDAWRVCLLQGANILLTDNGYVKLGERNAQDFCNYLPLQKTETELLTLFPSLSPPCLLMFSLHIIISVLTFQHIYLFIHYHVPSLSPFICSPFLII